LLDETSETIFPLDSGAPLATWEGTDTGRATLILKADIAWGDSSSHILTADDIISSWSARASERWDAKWALRAVAGIEDNAPGISGLQAIDERTLVLTVREGADKLNLERQLSSPALRLAALSGTLVSGTGPFILETSSGDRETLGMSASCHLGRPWIDNVDLIAYPSANESAVDFGRGSLDALLLTSNEQDQFTSTSRAENAQIEKISEALLVLVLNPARLPTLPERRSLALASDREGIANVVLGGGASPAGDFRGSQAPAQSWSETFDEARLLYSQVSRKQDRIVLLVCDDPAAKEAAGRLRANWEALGVPVEIRSNQGPPMLSLQADAVLLALRIPSFGEGVLPECLALYDRSSWWEIAAIALGEENARLLRRVRTLDPTADLGDLETAMQESSLVVPLVRYDVLLAAGPDVSMAPSFVYPGPALWRAYRSSAQ
jgi:ABC-type transport system substrate-binding protein